jgi:hypothetical protein
VNEPVTAETGDVFVEGVVTGVSSRLVDASLGDASGVDGVEEMASMFRAIYRPELSLEAGGQPPDTLLSWSTIARHSEVCK